MTFTTPAIVRSYELNKIVETSLNFEVRQFEKGFGVSYGNNDIADSQAVMDNIPLVAEIGQQPRAAAQIFTVSSIQVVTHNVCRAILDNKAQLANSNIQGLIAQIRACQQDDTIPAEIVDELPFDFEVLPDLRVQFSPKELPEEDNSV